ncbi:MAG: hypothetical protein ISR65_07300 [Bacteriovoracaceae bacterium]|nr:hypothetical protein [Bacteriovoracaceae bacterium]
MKNLTKIIIIFLAITGATSLLINLFSFEFGVVNYWQVHGIFFLIFITAFPRLTLLLSSVPFGGFFWWIGLIFAPRLLVAILATMAYWNTNKFLVIVAWLIAWGGESSEKFVIHNKAKRRFKTRTFQAEYTILD